MLTKIQLEIIKVFVSKIDKKFSIKQIAEILNKKYPMIHRSIKPLIADYYLLKDEQDLISLNYRNNHFYLAFAESVRKNDFLSKNKDFKMFFNECSKSLRTDFFISIIFGSSVEKKGRDTDLLFIFNESELEKNEKIIKNISRNFTLNLDINAISIESAYEMLSKREQTNVLNELLNNHILLFGGENFYRILNNARQ
ncbi:MAG: hypothetical protein AABW81_00070 [Nanoarchaeota archaeon]